MLKQTLEKLKQTKKIAEEEVAGDPRTRPGREMARREAQRALEGVRRDFATAFKKVGFPVFVSGPGAQKFAQLAAEEAETATVDYRQTTADIRNMVKSSIGNTREFGVTQFTILLREARQLGARLGLTSIPNMNFEEVLPVPREADVDSVVDQYLLKYLGAEFLGMAIEQEAVRQAASLPCESSVIPVVVLGTPEEIVEQTGPRILGGRHVAVSAPEVVDTDFVLKTFKSIKKTIKTTESTTKE